MPLSARYKKAIAKTTAIILVVAVLLVAAGVAIYLLTTAPAPAPTPTPTPTPSPTPTPTPTPTSTPTPPPSELATISVCNVPVRVPKEFADFVNNVRRGTITVEIYFGNALAPEERVGFYKAVDLFTREFPGVVVRNLEYAGMGEMQSKIIAVASLPPAQREGMVGKAPDVFTWAHDWIGMFADPGYIVSLEDYIGYDAVEDASEHILPVAMAAVTYKAKTYGLPYAGEALALFVNTQLVPKPPETFDEMLEIMKRFYKPEEGSYGISGMVGGVYHTNAWVTAFGGFYYDEIRREVGLLENGTKAGLEFFVRNVLRYMDIGDLGHDYQRRLFGAGKAPMYISGPWDVRFAVETFGIGGFTVAPLPSIDGRIPKPMSGFRNLYISVMAIHGGKERTYASILFVLYLSLCDEAVLTMVRELGYVPVKRSVVDYITKNLDEHPMYRIVLGFYQQLERSVPMPKDKNMQIVWGADKYITTIWSAYAEALGRGKTVDEAVEEAVAVIDTALRGAYEDIAPRLER